MRNRGGIDDDSDDRPILPWRLVAGAFLHFVVPFYLIAIVIDVLLFGPREAGAEAMLRHALAASPALLGGYAGAALLATLLAGGIDPVLRWRRERRSRSNPAVMDSRLADRVARAAGLGKGRFGPRADAALAALTTAPWQYGHPGHQAIARDLLDTVRASTAALASAPPERRAAIADMATATIERLANARRELADENAAQDERKARAAAGYVEMRYGPSDFSGDGD
ncbi:hypothetical protein [Sphingomonas oryzagri]|uniref:Uncharacterized protein n=1 Tax=Sphingomonas oryzagri TaxID=3042314 RepID=A0ABT6MXZ1_9SPHN|nr:hypothetical protein [Sphingomonas oryzagri]MDH7637797.1 hypothetical protein [Sphingomonas oryzagri]